MPHRNIKSSAAPCNSHSMMEPLFCNAVSVPAVHRYLQPCHVLLREVALVPLYLLKKTWWSVAGRFDFLLRWGGCHRLRCCGFLVLRRFRRFRRRRLWRRTLRLQSGKQILVPFAFFFPSSSKMAGRSSLGIAGKAAICASVALMRPVRISSCAPGTASSAASMPCEYFSARRTVFSPTPCSEAMR